ncbi:hypothetical protein [Cochleicola gelatinilyticus]|uniref:Trimeric autotransporter adhesin YadA-like head domain-containing protein n=1 Tax=Cochleicola gelatinilyticus TaxID=1763537 RepID=A0A167HMU0_9FLAO|nr:hypothetical protein [Cochleicola gelatinilyticus]OAB78781.1 hypothetical protein ULVI_09370 [Cochleicola gelatinilyticus]
MAIIINTVNDKYFTLNNVQYAKIYTPLKQGLEYIAIYNQYDTRQQILGSTKYDEFIINGNQYNSQFLTIEALLPVVLNNQSGGPVVIGGNSNTGLSAINEGNGIGWRLKNRNPLFYGSIGHSATDLSTSGTDSDSKGATGNNSFASGNNTIASGTNSHAQNSGTEASGNNSFAQGAITVASGANSHAEGNNTIASGTNSHAQGRVSKAIGNNSFASGFNAISSGDTSTSIGVDNIAHSFGEVVTGVYATDYVPNSPFTVNSNDRIFNVGNGLDNDNRSDALTILKNGLVTVPSLSNSLIEDAADDVVVTKGYLNNIIVSGSSFVDVSNDLSTENHLSDAYRNGKTGFGTNLVNETVEISGSTKSTYEYNNGTTTSFQFGGENIASELGIPQNALKGIVLNYYNDPNYPDLRSFIYSGNFEAIGGQKNISLTQGLQNINGDAYALGFYHPLIEDNSNDFQIKLKARNANTDQSYIHINSLGYNAEQPILGKSLESDIEMQARNNEGEKSTVFLTPHTFEYDGLLKLKGYGKIFTKGYTHRDSLSKTGTDATTIGDAQTILGLDDDGNVMEIPTSDISKKYASDSHLSGVYTQIGGQGINDLGMNGMYDRCVTTDADLRGGSISFSATTGTATIPDSSKNLTINGESDYLTINDISNDCEIEVVIDNGENVEVYGSGRWQPFFQKRIKGNIYGRFRNINVSVSYDKMNWYEPENDNWKTTDFSDSEGELPTVWFGGNGAPSVPGTTWRYVRFQLKDFAEGSNSNLSNKATIVQLGMRHYSEKYAQQYIKRRDVFGSSAPFTATDLGTKGEMRVTQDYIYVCTATNTWKRTALSSW